MIILLSPSVNFSMILISSGSLSDFHSYVATRDSYFVIVGRKVWFQYSTTSACSCPSYKHLPHHHLPPPKLYQPLTFCSLTDGVFEGYVEIRKMVKFKM